MEFAKSIEVIIIQDITNTFFKTLMEMTIVLNKEPNTNVIMAFFVMSTISVTGNS